MILITRPEQWKRPYLASECKDLAIVKGHLFRPAEYYELTSLNPSFINLSRLAPEDVATVISRSWVGGCFSSEEGRATARVKCFYPVSPSLVLRV